MPPDKGQWKRYSQEDLEKAIEDVLRGSSIASAAKKFGIPRATLSNKVNGKTARNCRMGPKTFLPEDIEKVLAQWIQDVQKAGFPVTKEQLLDTVQIIVRDKKIKNPFTNDRPGRHWLESFMRRHPKISLRSSQNLTNTRASVTTEKQKNWYTEVYEYLKSEGYDAILQDPRRVYNADESAFFFNPAGNKVLAGKGDRSVYQRIASSDKECLTVFMSGNAAGEIPPPMVIFKYERLPPNIVHSVPEMWGIGKSENGWMTSKTFYECIGNILQFLHPWLVTQNVPLPVILFIDGHSSHLNQPTSELCVQLGIILVALYPNATHLIQPMDVSIFRALKSYWKSEVHNWRITNDVGPSMQKIHFCSVLKKAINKLDVSLFENGFRKCGLYPWDPSAASNIDENDAVVDENESEIHIEIQEIFHFIQAHIERSKRVEFNNTDIWTGDVRDTSLFLFYKKIQALCHTKDTDLKNNEIEEDPVRNDSLNNNSYHEETDQIHIEHEIMGVDKNETCSAINSIAIPTDLHSNDNTTTTNNNSDSVLPDFSSMNHLASCSENKVPSAFKNILFWPKETEKKSKQRKVDKIPSVVTSEAWQKYMKTKEENKIKLEEVRKKKPTKRRKMPKRGRNTPEKEKKCRREKETGRRKKKNAEERKKQAKERQKSIEERNKLAVEKKSKAGNRKRKTEIIKTEREANESKKTKVILKHSTEIASTSAKSTKS